MGEENKRELVLGIDLGTATSSAGTLFGDEVKLVVEDGKAAIPSAVYLPRRGDPLVGAEARRQLAIDPAGAIAAVKRILGAGIDEPVVRRHGATTAYELGRGLEGQVLLRIRDTDYAPEQIATTILRHLRDLAERRFDCRVRKIVAAVPAGAGPGFREALARAARLAHLEIVEMLPEPVAGALGLGLHRHRGIKPRRILICDFGGGTFEATVAVQQGEDIRPVACRGDEFLGGHDFDEALANAIASLVAERTGFAMMRDEARRQRLLHRCEAVKRVLSSRPEARITMRDAYVEGGSMRSIDAIIERSWIEPRWTPLVARATGVVERLLGSAGCGRGDIDQIALVGGTSHIPLFRRAVAEMFPGAPVATSNNASIAVALGLTLRTAVHSGRRMRTPAIGHAAA